MKDEPNNSRALSQWVKDAPQWLIIISQVPIAVPPFVHKRVMAASSGVAMMHHDTSKLILRAPAIRTGVQGAEPGHVQPVAVLHWPVDPGACVPL